MASKEASLGDIEIEMITRDEESMEEVHLQHRLLTPFMNKRVPPVPQESERTRYPLHHSNPLSTIFFWWLIPVIKVGYKRTLEPADLWYLDDPLKVETFFDRFQVYLERRVAGARAEHAKVVAKKIENGTFNSEEDDEFVYPKYATLIAVLQTFKWEYSFAVACLCFSNICFSLNPLLSKALINFVEHHPAGSEEGIGRGIGYAFGCAALILGEGFVINHSMHMSAVVGAKARALLTKVILDKSLKLNSKGKHKFPTGKVTSIMSTDVARIDLSLDLLPNVLAMPVPLIITIVLLIYNIGVASLCSIAVFLISIVFIVYATKSLFRFRKRANKFTDMRIGFMKELLNNMKIIKFYSWEGSYSKTITYARKKEMSLVLKMQVTRSAITSFAISLPQLSSMVAFLVMHAITGGKSAADVFSSLSLFNILAAQFMQLPRTLSSSSDALIGFGRINELLQCGEINQKEQEALFQGADQLNKENLAIKVTDANFEWRGFQLDVEEVEQLKQDKQGKTDCVQAVAEKSNATLDEAGNLPEKSVFKGLTNINLEIAKGEFVVITGLIGTGKSSLLNALAGIMHKSSGSLTINGSLLMCGQPWVQNATVKENIIFGAPYDKRAYKEVIHACSLSADLDILPAGDRTEIGERGITLSGGQKARINLARAVYAKKDIILLDDVLSAVDARVGKHIMDNCLLGLLADNTRILATHQLSLIGAANRVIFLNGDGSIDVGSVEELTARNEGFKSLMSYNAESRSEEKEEEVKVEEEERDLIRTQTVAAVESLKVKSEIDGRLFEKEERAVNRIGWSIYGRYIHLGAGIFKSGIVPVFFSSIVLTTFCQLFTNTWLSFWIEGKFADRSDAFYIGIYVMLTFLTVIFATCEFTLIVYIANRAARALNIKAVQRLIKAPMAFMDTTPMGRILNRFTKDTDSLDNEISEQLRSFIYSVSYICGVAILCIIYLPWFALAVPLLVAVFVCIADLYQASAREIKRLEAIQRSFVYNNFNETLGGIATIKAFSAQDRFMRKNDFLINKMNEANYITIANQRWLSILLDIIAAAFSLVVSILCVTRQFKISAASTGLLVSYVIQLAGQMSFLVRSMTQVENEMNSVERLCHYAYELDQEAPFEIPRNKPKDEWPDRGRIEFSGVSLSYRPGLPLVLKNMDAKVAAGEKIGICGRTGAGKSSIMTALYRMSELSEGSITIDGVDISKIGLHDLRSKLSIIPQDPVLLRGSIRKNLDPFNDYPDERLWASLHKSNLVDDIESVKKQTGEDLHKFHLDQVVEDDGANFSLGERQLIALARAVVRDSKILILDEATSSVDYETDAKIQSTIVKEFSHCTILCIAHRLKTIIDYDRILVLDRGEVKEFDTPWHLFNNKGGIFKSMCEKSNISTEDFMRKD